MSLDMEGFVDDVFESMPATRFPQSGDRDSKGRWAADPEGVGTPHTINLQPLSDKELANLGAGAERVQDFRKFYVNDGDLYSITPQDEWEFDTPDLAGKRFTLDALDNRPWRNYCKGIIHLNDR